MINDVLDFSKLEAGKVELEPVDFKVRKLVEEVGALLAPAASEKRLELLAYCLPAVPEVLSGDAGRIRQILLNLAANAVKFTSSGEVSIKVGVSSVEDDQVWIRFEVSDTGIGIADDGRAMLFQAFSQGGRIHDPPLRRHRSRSGDLEPPGPRHAGSDRRGEPAGQWQHLLVRHPAGSGPGGHRRAVQLRPTGGQAGHRGR